MCGDRYNWRFDPRDCLESCFTLLGALVVGTTGLWAARAGGRGVMSLLVALMGMFYLVPGILYIVFSIFLSRRQTWAIVATMALASLHGLLAMVVLIGGVLQQNVVGIVGGALWAAALGQLVYHLSQSFASVRAEREEYAPRGFEPIPYGGQVAYPPPPPPPPQGVAPPPPPPRGA